MDKTLNQTIDILKKNGRYDNTIIIITADHADMEKRSHIPGRLASFYNEMTAIPLIIKFPTNFFNDYPNKMKTVATNTTVNVANIDLSPTILEIMGVGAENQSITNLLRGQSLFTPIAPDRPMITLNTNDWRSWSQDGFGITIDNLAYVFSNIEGLRCFDHLRDPGEKNSICANFAIIDKQKFNQIINSNHFLKNIYAYEAP